MRVASFPCPHCATRLRVRDRRFVGETIACPECKQAVDICESGAGNVTAVAHRRDSAGHSRAGNRPAIPPAWIARIVAGSLVVGLLVFLSLPERQPPEPQGLKALADTAPPPGEMNHPPAGAKAAGQTVTLQQRLAALRRSTIRMDAAGENFPRGTIAADGLTPEQRFSWQAALLAQREPQGPQPQWRRPWNDPANDQFVRRQQPLFLNPQLDVAVTDDRYPATHFVGVAGVGDDAASLPSHDSRAGIFGHDRQTRLADVGDGLAQTMVVVGVRDRLGSWAAGGSATVRGFSAEPYINGPDGIGSGDADGMHVLMADGSVRFLAGATSPRIIRRMAAMNDGLPLDESVPGEPGAVPTETPPPQQAAAADRRPDGVAGEPVPEEAPENADAERVIADIVQPADVPIDVPMAEPVVAFDIERALSQRIVRFDQRDPVPVRDLLRLVEEMAAVPISVNELSAEMVPRLSEPIRLTRENTTVGEILQAIVEAASLTFDGRPSGIFIRAPQPPGGDGPG